MQVKILNVETPVYSNETNTMIDLIVTFEHIGFPVTFTASPDDGLIYGRNLYQAAQAGVFGTVAPYVPPAPPAASQQAQPATSGVQTL